MSKSVKLGSVFSLFAAAGILVTTTGCDPLVEGASAGLIAATEYFITTPIQFWVDESLMNNTAE